MNKITQTLTFACGVGLAAGAAMAQDDAGPGKARAAIAGRYYVAPMASYTLVDDARGTDDGYGGVLALGKQLVPGFSLEIAALYSSLDSEQGGDSATLTGGQITALFFPGQHNFYGLIGLGFGQVKDHPGLTPDYNNSLWSAGAGYLLGPFDFVASGMSVRAEALLRGDSHEEAPVGETVNNVFREAVFNLGLLVPLGAGPKPAPEPEPEPVQVVALVAPVDTDGDGVNDDLDQCPGTAAGTEVDAAGCPKPEPEPEPAPACAPPAPGQPITLEGCAAGDTVVLSGVNFDFDTARLTPNARTILDGVADALLAAPQNKVELGGHTDAIGADAYNLRLSERRAQSVMDYLVERGVEVERMSAVGHGESMPVADNQSEEGREQNRRVELTIIE